MANAFWDDLQDDVRDDPIRAEQLAIEIARIQSIDLAINRIDQARNAQGVSKAQLATKIGKNPAWLRRLFTRTNQNPQFGTIAAMAAALGYRLEFVPIDDGDVTPGQESSSAVHTSVSGEAPRIA